MLVYTTPGFTTDRTYLVLHFLHRIRGDEEEWHRRGKPEVILDNLYAARKIATMIVVMTNGRAQKNDRAEGDVFRSAPAFEDFEAVLLKDVIPFIEAQDPARKGPENRAPAALLMVGGQSVNFGLGNLDTFAWVGGFSSAPNTRAPEKLLPKPEDAAPRLKLLWVSCGDKDGLIEISQRVHGYLKVHHVPHVWHVDSGPHNFDVWKNDLYLFSQQIFR